MQFVELPQPVGYLRWFASALLAATCLILLVNWMVDPYQLGTGFSMLGQSDPKPFSAVRAPTLKAVALKRLRPQVLILGNSRTDIGIDPADPAIPRRGVPYNAAIPAGDMLTQARYFQLALEQQPDLKLVVIGIDLVSFWPPAPQQPVLDEVKAVLSSRHPFFDALDASFSGRALLDSIRTVLHRFGIGESLERYAANGLLHRRNPRQMTSIQAMERHLRQAYLGPQGWYNSTVVDDGQIAALRSIVEECRRRGIELRVFVSPSHIAQWQALQRSGRWPQFEELKRRVVEFVPLWDFSGPNAITTEPLSERMSRYLEASHYLPEVGNLVLARLFDVPFVTMAEDFGVLLDRTNIEFELEQSRSKMASWQQTHPQVVELVERWHRAAHGQIVQDVQSKAASLH